MKHLFKSICIFLLLPAMVQAGDVWLPIKDISLLIEPGSVLDFSTLSSSPQPIKSRLIVNQLGHFSTQDNPQKNIRFLMGSLGFSISTGGFPDHAMADLYARQFRMHGYNMARLDFIEDTLMHGRAADFDFNPEQLDRLHYLLFALKREGIYYMLNGLSSGNAAYGNIKERWINQRKAKQGVYYDIDQQGHWKKLMDKLFVTINPYTGTSTLNDPALAGIILVNEGGLAFTNRNGVIDALRPQFADWLKKNYGTTAALSKAWKGELSSSESLENSSVLFPKPDASVGIRMADTQQFFVDLENKTADWMTQYLRRLGYQGMITAYNNWLSPAAHVSRGKFDWVDMHNYFSEPTNDTQTGSVMRQDSLLTGGAAYIRELAVGKHIGKAFSVSEFGQIFWNKYRRENGLAFPAYAAFQGWDVISQHAHAIKLSYESGKPHKDIVGPFNVGLDPVVRAGETLAALLYVRGDVAPARNLVGIKVMPKFVFKDNAHLGNIPGDISRLSLLTGVGLDWQGRSENKYHAQVTPDDTNITLLGKLSVKNDAGQTAVAKVDGMARAYAGNFGSKVSKINFVVNDKWAGRVDSLRKNGFLGKENITDPKEGVYQTDTGQVVMDSQRRRLTVITPNTEAVVFDSPESIVLDNFTVEQADGPALVSVSSMDGQPLQASKHMLVILATDARNSGMRFADAAETTLLDLGKKPVLIKTVKIKLKLKNQNAAKLKVFSNTLRGKRGDVISLTHDADSISFVLDTAKLSHGPTTYFEITSLE
ncbi:MAG: hypothetical protein Q7U70_02985 [Methylotenera sp.]|nr:hypothetical protein [Methylotenera sp.]